MPTLTIRLTDEQAQEIENEAAAFGLTRGSVIKKKVFAEKFSPRKVPRPDQVELARLVAELGKIGSNINQIAKQMNQGNTPPPAELIISVKGAREGLEKIGSDVKRSLGIKEG